MPDFEIVCLANSKKRGGRCVAGLRTDGEGWIRPVAWNPEGTLQPPHYTLPDGTEARLLDLLRVRCIAPRPDPHHPENWTLAQRKWELVSRPAPSESEDLLRAHCVTGPELLGSREDRIPFASFAETPAQASLALVAPDELHWIIKTNTSGERRVRVAFTLVGTRYNLALTDPVWEAHLSSLPLGEHPFQAAGQQPSGLPLLTISLSEPFQAEEKGPTFCYKLVAAIIALPSARPNPGINPCSEPQNPPARVELGTRREENDAPRTQAASPLTPDKGMKQDGAYQERLEQIRTVSPRAYESWSESEDNWLTQLFHAGHSEIQIATHLQRQQSAVRSRIKKLNLNRQAE